MTNEDTNKVITQIEEERDRIQVVNQNLTDQIEEIPSEEIEELQKQLKDKEAEKTNIEASNRNTRITLENIANTSGALAYAYFGRKPGKDIYKITIGGIDYRVDPGTLNNLLRNINVHFAYLENPFKDTYSEPQK